MRRFAILAVAATVLALCGHNAARAQTATGTGTSSSSSNSGAVAISGGGQRATSSIVFNTPSQQRVDSNVNYRQSGSVRTTVAAVAPGLAAAGIESCNSSLSGGIGATGWGISLGGPIMDNECNLRLWARTTWAMGQRELTAAIISQSPTVMKAMQILDQQGRGGGVTIATGGRPAAVAYGAPGTPSRRGMYAGCKKWSGGATGVGSCVVAE